MYRIIEYTILFAAVTLLQVLLFGNLIVSFYAMPHIYIAFLILLPLDTPPFAMLMLGLITGITMDATMGLAGINTIASLGLAFARPLIAHLTLGHDALSHSVSVPSPLTVGLKDFLLYTLLFSFLHCSTVFILEALGFDHFMFTLGKISVSTVTTVLLVWLIANMFTARDRKET